LSSFGDIEKLKPLLESPVYNGKGSLANPRFNESDYHIVRVVFIGESGSGKTSLIERYTKRKVVGDAHKSVHEQFRKTIRQLESEHPLELILIDTPGSEAESKLRTMEIAGADVFVVCFSLSDPLSLENLQTKWLPELIVEGDIVLRNVPYLLVGCQNDRRTEDPKFSVDKLVSFAHQVKAFKYLECSSKDEESCVDVIHEAIAACTSSEFEDK